MSRWRSLRIALLLLVLGLVALDAWLTRVRTTDWDAPLRLTLYPIVADGRDATRDYVEKLQRDDFTEIESFLKREAQAHGITTNDPLRIKLGTALKELPPAPPPDRGLLGTVWWSLKLRWWSRGIESDQPRPRSQVRVYVLYYDPETSQRLSHSLGLQKGLIGVVHAFASRAQAPTNNVVIAHELLHTLGASDKYDPGSGLPRYPDGYAEPQLDPRYPQTAAELMGGRIPLSPQLAEIPVSLKQVVIRARTAREIGWTKTP